MHVFLTGTAGFIGFHTALSLLKDNYKVTGVDNLCDYYSPRYKELRLDVLRSFKGFEFHKGDIADSTFLGEVYKAADPSHVVHLAAQAGVRYSIENPGAYIHSNIVGFQNMIELARHSLPRNFVYASSSSVYGGNKVLPFSEKQSVMNPISLYAATKISNELVARSYGNLYGLNTSGFRFFTVYGPYGRPDMAMFLFADKMRRKVPIQVFNNGEMMRDFTFIDDIVSGVLSALKNPKLTEVYNLGRGKQESLLDMIHVLEKEMDVKAQMEFLPMQLGDVKATLADISKAKEQLGYEPRVNIEQGISQFVSWYLKEHPAV